MTGVGTKKKSTAILLCLICLHRFYLGKVMTGVLQLVTFGGFFIWWLLDLNSILKGTMKDGQGLLLKTGD